jgi:hypothetical protein
MRGYTTSKAVSESFAYTQREHSNTTFNDERSAATAAMDDNAQVSALLTRSECAVALLTTTACYCCSEQRHAYGGWAGSLLQCTRV